MPEPEGLSAKHRSESWGERQLRVTLGQETMFLWGGPSESCSCAPLGEAGPSPGSSRQVSVCLWTGDKKPGEVAFMLPYK